MKNSSVYEVFEKMLKYLNEVIVELGSSIFKELPFSSIDYIQIMFQNLENYHQKLSERSNQTIPSVPKLDIINLEIDEIRGELHQYLIELSKYRGHL